MSTTGELQRLMEAGDYAGCIALGKAMLGSGELPISQRARILGLLCRCQVRVGDFQGAVQSGEAAVDLAGELGEVDLQGMALLDLASGLVALSRQEEALDRLQEAAQRLARSRGHSPYGGDKPMAEDSLLGRLAAALSEGDDSAVALLIAEGEAHAEANPSDLRLLGRLLLARAHHHALVGEEQASVDEAFRVLLLAEPLSTLQVEAQLHLSRMAERMKRQVEALSFAFAARVSAIDGRLYCLEMEASMLLVRLMRRYGEEALGELQQELASNGVDLYSYADPGEVQQILAGE